MKNIKKKYLTNKHGHAISDLDKIIRRIQSSFMISLSLDRMSDSERKKHDDMWRRAKPQRYDNLTEAEKNPEIPKPSRIIRSIKRCQECIHNKASRIFGYAGIAQERQEGFN